MKPFIRYCLTSGISFILTFGTCTALYEFGGLDAASAGGAALVIAFIFNFLAGRYFVFQSGGDARAQAIRYLIASLVFRSAEYAAYAALVSVGTFYLLALFAVLAFSQMAKFFTYRAFVFR